LLLRPSLPTRPPEETGQLSPSVRSNRNFYNRFALAAMLEGGYEIYMVADASGGTSKEAHDYAMLRMIQAGVVPVTWQQVVLEWQRDWAHRDTYDAVIAVVREHSGAYGMGVDYAYTMVHKAPQRTKALHEALAPVAAS
jgi:nicotinamidase-related amidase